MQIALRVIYAKIFLCSRFKSYCTRGAKQIKQRQFFTRDDVVKFYTDVTHDREIRMWRGKLLYVHRRDRFSKRSSR